jgi:glutamate-ammonia-ligase adenylyltransferase
METFLAVRQDQYDRLLSAQVTDQDAIRMLAPVGFADPRAVHRSLLRLAGDARIRPALADLLPHLLAALYEAAAPDRVLVNLLRFTDNAADRPATVRYLADNPRAVDVLVTLFAGSQFLTEILLRNPETLERLMARRQLSQARSLDELWAEAEACATAPASGTDGQLDALRRFQRLELLRIGACDLLGLYDLPTVTAQLSDLAEALVRACLSMASAQTGTPIAGFVVLGMGKLGGRELNYSSDIDLLFLAASDPTSYLRLGERLIDALMRMTAEGFLYRVDMRIRPWGQVGALIPSLDGYMTYLQRNARPWEKQALLKARPVAGDEWVGTAFLRRAAPLVYGGDDLDRASPSLRDSVRAMKQRTEDDLQRQGREWGEVKLGQGSIRDVEFVVQYLQLAYGAEQSAIRSRTTLDALRRLEAHGYLSPGEHRALDGGYVFFRTIEHHLQMMHYRQTNTLPDDPGALLHLAQRLGFRGQEAGQEFLARYEEHRAAIRAVYLRHLGSDDMDERSRNLVFSEKPGFSPSENAASEETPDGPIRSDPQPADLVDHVARMDASYTTVFDQDEIRRHTALAALLDADNLVEVEAMPLDDGRWRVTIVAYDYPGELSLICGLLFVYGLSIHDGYVFTYGEAHPARAGGSKRGGRRKIVDAFTVEPVRDEITAGTWMRYADDLAALLRLLQDGRAGDAPGELANRVAAALRESEEITATLYPVGITIDNSVSDRYTVLRIDAPDTAGFLYELTNALALRRVYIAQVTVNSVGDRVQDVLYVTDANGRKITDPERQRELRAATVLIKHFTHLLPHSPNPESAMLRFRQFIAQLFQRPDWPDELASLDRPEVLDALARLLGVSEFLWDDFLRMQYANLFPVVRDVDALESSKSREQLQAELEAELGLVHDGPQPLPGDSSAGAPWRATLNAFKDREMFRVDMRHIMGHTPEFGDFSQELTDLAEVVVNAAYHLCHEDLRALHGAPLLEDGTPSEMAVCALGKCGGRELGFASDIELMFVYAGNGRTTGPQAITTAEFYERLVQDFVRTIQAKREGIFEVDLQLRPYGKAGSMAVSLEAFRRYFAPDGPAWAYERQALVKLRPIAGNPGLGQHVAALRDQYVYTGAPSDGAPFDVTAMRAMRERQVRHLVTGGTFNAKYSPGGLVDVEYLVQGLQITYGHVNPDLRQTNIREAMAALAEVGILSPDDHVRLRRAHTFLRWLIDGLRMVRGNAKDLTVPPAESEAFAFLARRLRYGNDVERLREELEGYTASVRELSGRLLDRL